MSHFRHANATPMNILENERLRTLHFGTPAVQGAMHIDRPNDIQLEYVQQMMLWLLFRDDVAHVAQLGLGAAALTKFCYHHLPSTRVTAVELDSGVIDICRTHFALPREDARLRILNKDALDFVADFSNRRSVDVLQVDVYDAQATGPSLSSAAFYGACANCLTHNGIMTVNLYCDWPEHLHHLQLIEQSFAAVAWLPEVHDGNIVAIAFKKAPSVDFDELRERARHIHATWGLPADSWVDGLYQWMSHGEEA